MHADSIVVDIGLAIVVATALAYLARLLRQPLLLAYIGAGLLIGPPVLGLVHSQIEIAHISELGLAFLMFIVGLEIDLKKLVSSGRAGAIAGTIQVVVCAVLAVGFMLLLGYGGLYGLYLGVASAFSSTMIVIKLLSDKGELDTVDGQLTLGVLLVQDALAIVVLALQPNLDNPSPLPILKSLASGAALVGFSLVVSRYVLPALFRWVAKSPEILLISAISWCLVVGYLAILANFSVAMGALIAGITLSAFPYSLDVIAKIRQLRDFFVTLFFVALGMQLEIQSIQTVLIAVALSAFVIATRFIVVMPTLYYMGYGTRVGALCALSLAQVGEFALVILAVGMTLAHVTSEIASIAAISLVITSTVSTYMIAANHAIAGFFVKLLTRFGIRDRASVGGAGEGGGGHHQKHEVVLLGFHRAASSLLYDNLGVREHHDILVVDLSPETQRKLTEIGVPAVYGDISNFDTLEHVGIEHAKLIISTVSEDFLRGTDNLTILLHVRRLNPHARVIVSAETIERARTLYAAGADYVVLPRIEIGQAYREIIEAFHSGELEALRARTVEELSKRQEVMA